ncbi:MAG TPA: TIM-barrel domain-containing protein [Sphingomicrobium sp.]
MKPCLAPLAAFLLASAAPAVAQNAAIRAIPGGIAATSGDVALSATALTDNIVRVRIARGGRWPEDASWAVPAAVRRQSVAVRPTADGFATGAVAVHLDPRTLGLSLSDLQGKTIVADAPAALRFDGAGFTLRKSLPIGEHIYGLGDKTGPLDRRGSTFVDWNTDAFGFAPSTDPIYKSIPFFIGVDGDGGAYGLFLDNSWRVSFDFGHKDASAIEIGAPAGPIDYYLIAGPTVADVVRRYTDLTGKPPLPPQWALGYQQSRWGYMSDADIRGIAGHLRSDRIPADVIWMDIDYQDRERPFTVNTKTFPDLKKLNSDMLAKGIRLVAITDLHVAYLPNQGYAPFDTGIAGNHFVHKADGSLYVAPVWPGPSVFPDFTRAATRQWWGGLYKDFIADGFSGFWNDMNEPAVFETPTKTMPLDNIHRIESDDFAPRNAIHSEIHNVFGMQNTRGTMDGMLRLRPGVRPFVMTRASFAGGQRYAVTWTGDNSSTWDHLRLCIQQLANLGLSGFSYAGCDVGGFIGGASPELLTRWYELAAFTPVFRNHSAHDAPRMEPWVDGPQHLTLRRKYIEERYRLMPYLYALADQNARTGDPVMRPLFYDYPDALKLDCDSALTFSVGRDLVVAAPPRPESPQPQPICLPAGSWFDYWTGLPVTERKIMKTPRLAEVPVYVRAGAIIPRQALVQSTSDAPKGPLQLDIYPGGDCRGQLYFDDGLSIGGPSLRQSLACTVTKNGISLQFGPREGAYKPWWSKIAVTVHGAKPVHKLIADQPAAGTVEIGR